MQARQEGRAAGDSGNDDNYGETTAIRRSTRVLHECVLMSARRGCLCQTVATAEMNRLEISVFPALDTP